jgi:hypothetical protein
VGPVDGVAHRAPAANGQGAQVAHGDGRLPLRRRLQQGRPRPRAQVEGPGVERHARTMRTAARAARSARRPPTRAYTGPHAARTGAHGRAVRRVSARALGAQWRPPATRLPWRIEGGYVCDTALRSHAQPPPRMTSDEIWQGGARVDGPRGRGMRSQHVRSSGRDEWMQTRAPMAARRCGGDDRHDLCELCRALVVFAGCAYLSYIVSV